MIKFPMNYHGEGFQFFQFLQLQAVTTGIKTLVPGKLDQIHCIASIPGNPAGITQKFDGKPFPVVTTYDGEGYYPAFGMLNLKNRRSTNPG